jgi:hypothetical protein
VLKVAVICCVAAVTTTLYGMPDDIFDVYVDGVKVISNCESSTPSVCNATVNLTSSLIAVNLVNTLGPGFSSCRLAMAAVLQRCRGDARLPCTRNGRTWTLTTALGHWLLLLQELQTAQC